VRAPAAEGADVLDGGAARAGVDDAGLRRVGAQGVRR
jgi:hypothetical protein